MTRPAYRSGTRLTGWLLPLACLLLAACVGGSGPPGGGAPAPQWPPENVYEGPAPALEKLSKSVGEVPRGMPRVATDGLGNALAVWPLRRAGAAENGGDLYLLHYVAFNPATGTWSEEREVPGYAAGTQEVFSNRAPNPKVERILGGPGGILLAWRQFDGAALNLHLALYRNGQWQVETPIPLFAEGQDPDTGSTTVNEVILDAVATSTGFAVLTGRTITSAGSFVSDHWVRRLTFDGNGWTDEGRIVHEGIFIDPATGQAVDTSHVIDSVAQHGGLTGIQMRHFQGSVESPSVRIIDAARNEFNYPLPDIVPPSSAPGTSPGDPINPTPILQFKSLHGCGDRFVAVASATWAQSGVPTDSVWGIDFSVNGAGPLTRLGAWREQFFDMDIATNDAGCLVAYRRDVGAGAAHNVWGVVFRNGAWGATKYLQYVNSGGILQAAANAHGYAVLYSSRVRGTIFDYFVAREQNGAWSLGNDPMSGAVQGIRLFENFPVLADTLYLPLPRLIPVTADRFAVAWIDGTGMPHVMVSGGFAGGSTVTWGEVAFGATKDMAIYAGAAGGGGNVFMAWASPFSKAYAGMAALARNPANGLFSGSMEPATLRPTAPASKLATTLGSVNGDALVTWYQPQYGVYFSRAHLNGAWQGAPPDIPDLTGTNNKFTNDGNLFSAVTWTNTKVNTINLPVARSSAFPNGDWTELSAVAKPVFVFNTETAAANGRTTVAWEQETGIYYCIREEDPVTHESSWGCDPNKLFEGYLPASQGTRIAAGPGGFALLMDGKADQGNSTFVTVYEKGLWRLPVELGVNSGWVIAAGTGSYAAATSAGKRVEIRHYLNGEWGLPLVVGPMEDSVRNVRLLPRAGGGYALFFQVGTGTAHTWGAMYYNGRWSAPVDLGPGKLAAAAARPEGFLAVIDSYDAALNQVYRLKHYEQEQLLPLPDTPEWADLKFLPQVAVGPYTSAALATRGGVLYGLRLWPGSGGLWDDPVPLNQDNGLPVADSRLVMSGANFTATWLQAEPQDPALPHVWAAGLPGVSGP